MPDLNNGENEKAVADITSASVSVSQSSEQNHPDSPINSTGQKKPTSKKGIIVTAIILIALIIVAGFVYNSLASTTEPDQTVKTNASSDGSSEQDDSQTDEVTVAPDFPMTSLSGQEISLSDFQGRPVVLNFWASTCGPCRSEMPEFQSAYEKYADRIDFVMLNVPDFNGETKENALALIEQRGFTFPVYFQIDNTASILYGINSIPRTYFITADGNIEAYAAGAINEETLENGISMILQ